MSRESLKSLNNLKFVPFFVACCTSYIQIAFSHYFRARRLTQRPTITSVNLSVVPQILLHLLKNKWSGLNLELHWLLLHLVTATGMTYCNTLSFVMKYFVFLASGWNHSSACVGIVMVITGHYYKKIQDYGSVKFLYCSICGLDSTTQSDFYYLTLSILCIFISGPPHHIVSPHWVGRDHP